MRTVALIDADIDANRLAIMSRIHANPGLSAQCWHNAWKVCPDLAAKETALFVERGHAQAAADREETKKYQALTRRARHHIRAALELTEENRLSLAVQGRSMIREIDAALTPDSRA